MQTSIAEITNVRIVASLSILQRMSHTFCPSPARPFHSVCLTIGYRRECLQRPEGHR